VCRHGNSVPLIMNGVDKILTQDFLGVPRESCILGKKPGMFVLYCEDCASQK